MSFSKKGAAESRQQNGNGFRTDSAISGNRQQGERVLQPWVPDENIPVNMSLESSNKQSGGAGWDQFAVNERLFGLKTDYDETIYTTAIDKSHPEYSKRYAAADRKAREIENSVANNRHVEEERMADNLAVDDSGLDEEDNGVQRQEFPPLSVTGRADRYTPPARRAPSGKATVSGAPVDPAIISSQLARPPSEAPSTSTTKPEHTPKVGGPEVSTPPTTTESSFAVTPEPKATPTNTSTSASGAASPHPKVTSTPNATATVERDVVTAFRGFAAQQRTQADKLRMSKAKADKEEKLQELKAFASSFKLHSPLPNDLVAIIAKDPAKQRAIQENARRQAEEVQQEKQMKADAIQVPRSGLVTSDQRTSQRSGAATGTVSASATSNRQTPGRGGYPLKDPTTNRSDRIALLALRNIEQNKNGLAPPGPGTDARQPPTGPAHGPDTSASRRTSATALLGKLNPNSHEFRPSPFAAAFSPNGNPSNASSPRSASATASQGIPSASGTLLRRKPGTPSKAKADGPVLDIIERLARETPPQGRDWSSNGGIKPAYDTPQLGDKQPPLHMHNNQSMQQNSQFHSNDDHRMVPSHSAQSYASPRLAQVNVAYPSPMGQPAQLSFQQPGMQYPVGPGGPQMAQFRSYSGGHQFMPQQPTHMGGPVMIQGPAGSFIGNPNLMAPGPPMMYPVNQAHFTPQGNGPPPPMAGSNGYPSPGRSAPMMMPGGSQQGQQVYGMSPGMQYGQPIYAQQPPGQSKLLTHLPSKPL
ncbi:poly(A)-binding protein binding protein [Pseudogymnoascus australis]